MSRILVVDDEKDVRDVLQRFFADKGYEVLTCASADEALALLGKTPVGAVLLDIQMPGMDGVAALQRIKEIQPDLPVVMVSGQTDEELAQEALQAGAFDYVTKPLDFGYLERTVYFKLLEVLS
jgi:two-component system C4-dicarboxylate transport response regulator DctD